MPEPASDGSAPREWLRLRPGVRFSVTSGGDPYLFWWPRGTRLRGFGPLQHTVLERLSSGRCTEESLCGLAVVRRRDEDPAQVRAFLRHLRQHGWLEYSVAFGSERLYTVRPIRPMPQPADVAEDRWLLSQFAIMRRVEHGMLVESPTASANIQIHNSRVLARLNDLAQDSRGTDPLASQDAVARRLFGDLRAHGFLVPALRREGLRHRQWGAHELWFHERSTLGARGRLGDGFGGTFWAKGLFDPLPARRPGFSGTKIDLYRPDLKQLRKTDPGVTAVLEDRRSIREHDHTRPLTADQVGEFLYRTARVRNAFESGGVEYVSLPIPSAGAFGELELYLAVHHVAGLPKGLFHYDAHDHRLDNIDAADAAVQRIIAEAGHAALMRHRPQLLVLITARFGRLMWKYEGLGYALILKNVGVMYQMMYTVATTMGLAPCALGAANAELLTAMTKEDPLVESGVGEFLLGSRSEAFAAGRPK